MLGPYPPRPRPVIQQRRQQECLCVKPTDRIPQPSSDSTSCPCFAAYPPPLKHTQQVQPATEQFLLNQQRIELNLNHRGRVLSVNNGASKSVFGVEPKELVGKPLASFINVIGQWKAKFGSEESLLTMLALRVEQNHDAVVRCGLHNPFTEVRGFGGGLVVVCREGGTSINVFGQWKAKFGSEESRLTIQALKSGAEPRCGCALWPAQPLQ